MRTTFRACGSSKPHGRPNFSTLPSRNDVSFDEPALVRFAHGDFGKVHDRARTADRQLERELPEPFESADAARADIALDAGIAGGRNGAVVAGAKEHTRQANRPQLERIEK